MKSICLILIIAALLSPANAVARIWIPLAPFDPTVHVAARFAAKMMVGPGSFFHVLRAWGSDFYNKKPYARFQFFRVHFTSGRLFCQAFVHWQVYGLPIHLHKIMPTFHGMSRCYLRKKGFY